MDFKENNYDKTKKENKQMKQTKPSTFNQNTMFSELTDLIFDWEGLLHRLMGDEDLAEEIVDDFLKQIPFMFTAVKEALNKHDAFLVKREAHNIKGASGNVGAVALQKIAEQIEIAVEEKDFAKAELFVAKFDTQLEILKNKLIRPKA